MMKKSFSIADLLSQDPEQTTRLVERGLNLNQPGRLGANMDQFCNELGLDPAEYMQMLKKYVDEVDAGSGESRE
ncbi:MAG: hypothetical protein GX495_07535 [Chloroflexi bacterium]|jgi:hypothetical protein|nr:hypothetical protein [Chloroflexota bacterium]